MDITFAYKKHPIEPLGMAYVSSSIDRGGHKSNLILTPKNLDQAVNMACKKIEETGSKIFAQGVIFGSHGYAADLSKGVKERHPEVISILGGSAPTFTPELLDKGFDVVCRYEGENPFLEFCNAVESGGDVGNIPNIWVNENSNLYHTIRKKNKEITDPSHPRYGFESGFDQERNRFVNAPRKLLAGDSLDEIPNPDRPFLYEHDSFADGPIKHFMHTRGCAFSCSYCFNVVQNMEFRGNGAVVRRRKHESVTEEIRDVMDKWNMESAYFEDDVIGFGYKVQDARDFAEIYSSEVDRPFHAHIRFDLVNDNMAKALADAGCSGVHVAIEAGDDYIRNKVHGRGMSVKQVIEGAESLRKYGIKMMTQNILGAPGETKEQMIKTLELNIAVQPTFASASIFQPYPGTKALEYARDTGALPSGELTELVDTFGMESFYGGSILIMDPKEKKWLETFQKFFAIAVDQPAFHNSGALEKIINSYPDTPEAKAELMGLYRQHRAEKDKELYGVEFKDTVDEDEGVLNNESTPLNRIE